jgi:putative inorganic carbon (hco3(-)) transporter
VTAPALTPDTTLRTGRPRVTPAFVVVLLVVVALVGASAGVAPVPVLAAGVVALAGARLLARPDLATLAVVSLIYSNAVVVGVRLHGVPEAIQYVVPLLLALPLADRVLRQREAFVSARALPFAVAFLVVQIISTMLSREPARAFEAVEVSALEGVALFVLVTNVVTSLAVLRRCLWCIAVAAAVLGGLSVVQFATGAYDQEFLGFAQPGEQPPPTDPNELSQPEPPRRLGGPIGEKNRYAQVLLLAVPVAAMLARTERTRELRVIAFGCSALALGGVVLTFSRGAALALVALVALGLVLRLLRPRQLLLPVLLAAVVLVALPQYRERLMTVSALSTATRATVNEGEGDGSIRSRVTENLAAVLVFADHPVIGVGPDLFPTYYGDYAQRVGIRIKNAEREAHNLYLDIAAELGALGLLAFLGMNIVVLRELLLVRRRSEDAVLGDLAAGLFLAVSAYLVTGIFLHFSFVRYFWLILGLAGAVGVLARREGAT